MRSKKKDSQMKNNKLQEQMKSNKKKVERYQLLQNQIQKIQEQITTKREEREKISGQIAALKAEIDMENKQFEEQQQNLRYEDWKQAEIRTSEPADSEKKQPGGI